MSFETGTNFIDYVRIFCKSGDGGNGSMHLHRAKYVPKGGPDGGDGGRGGHIILRGNKQMWTLIHLKYKKHIKAEDGGAGSGQLKHGKQGADIILQVPLGTVAKDVPQVLDDALVILVDVIRRYREPGQGYFFCVHMTCKVWTY